MPSFYNVYSRTMQEQYSYRAEEKNTQHPKKNGVKAKKKVDKTYSVKLGWVEGRCWSVCQDSD